MSTPLGSKKSPRKGPKAKDTNVPSSPGNPKFTFEEKTKSNRQSALLARRASIKLDVASFAAETYLPEYYLKTTMGTDSEESIQASLRSLGAARDKSIAELRRAVYKNHVEFLEVSRGMLDFEGVLGELRLIQSQFKLAANALVSSADESKNFSRKDQDGAATSSVVVAVPMVSSEPKPIIDTEARKTRMMALMENIADFERYITKDRYLIFEGGGITEQVGMSSPKTITLYLFNDAIAMASKKSRMILSSSSKRLVLERFWLLREIVVSDVPDSKSLINAFKITKGGEYVLMQAETATGKRLWLQQITKTQKAGEEDLVTPRTASPKPASGPFGSRRASPLLKGTGKSAILVHRRIPSSLSGKKVDASGIEISDDKLNSLVSLLDSLNTEIDECNYERAAEIVDKIKFELSQMDNRSIVIYQLLERLQKHVAKLASYLYHEITDLIISKENMSRFIQLLVLLGFSDEAREKFLAARSNSIKDRTKHLRYTGDIAKTVNDIGFTTFQSIKSTADWYISSFKDNPMTAGFVFWTKLEINNYVNVIVKQVFTEEADFRLIGDCIRIARRHCTSLDDIGLDLVFYLDDQLLPHIDSALRKYQEQVERSLSKAIEADDYLEDKVEAALRDSNHKGITISCLSFNRSIMGMLNDVEPLLQGEVSEIMVARIVSLFENYSTNLVQASYSPSISIAAFINILGNVSFLVNDFLASLTSQLENRFNRLFADLSKLYARLEATVNTLHLVFAETLVKKMVPSELSCYSVEGPFEGSKLSDWLVTMLPLYAKISRDIKTEQRTKIMQELLLGICREIQRTIQSVKFSATGIQQFLLDMHFLVFSSKQFLNGDLTTKATETCAMALRIFKQTNVSQQSINLQTEEWFDQQAQSISSKYPLEFGK